MLRKLLFPFILALPLAGCSTSRDVRLADGWMTHVISCGGPLLNMGHCQEKAGDVCGGRGYRVLNHTGGELPGTANAIPTGGLPDMPESLSLDEYQARKLFIKCN